VRVQRIWTSGLERLNNMRYVHIMGHPDYEGQLKVGCICAGKMENDYMAPRKRENDLRNRHKRMMNFLRREWEYRSNGNMVLKYKGQYITIMPSKFNLCHYGVIYGRSSIWSYREKKINNIETAKLAAFNVFDK
jgi:hypothetical protein